MAGWMRMFPLGGVHFPGTLIPLRVFEPRYLTMMDECRTFDEPFAVVLIERGFEVGGGDTRFQVGTEARVVDAAELPGGHLAVVAAATGRIAVTEWLPDDPYPRATVREFPDEPPIGAMEGRVAEVDAMLRAILTLVSEAGTDVGAIDYRLAEDPSVASFQLSALAPIATIDAQRLLEATGPEPRLDRLAELLDEERRYLRARLAGG